MALVESEATKLSFTWADLPLDDPRIVLKQNECDQFQSLPGDSCMQDLVARIEIIKSSGQLHYKMVKGSEGVIVREGNLSLTTSSLEVTA